MSETWRQRDRRVLRALLTPIVPEVGPGWAGVYPHEDEPEPLPRISADPRAPACYLLYKPGATLVHGTLEDASDPAREFFTKLWPHVQASAPLGFEDLIIKAALEALKDAPEGHRFWTGRLRASDLSEEDRGFRLSLTEVPSYGGAA